MDIEINLDKQDWRNYQSYVERELSKHHRTWMDSFWVNVIVWFVVAFSFMFIFQQKSNFHWPSAISAAIIFVLIFMVFIFNIYKMKKAFEPSANGVFCGKHKFTFTENEIISEGKGYTGQHSWEIVQRIEKSRGMVLIFIDTAYAFVFPESKLENPEEFYNYVVEQLSNVTSGSKGRS